MIEYDKTQEKLYKYWQAFGHYDHYNTSALDNEPYIYRSLALGFVKEGQSFLDVGCGGGATYQYIKDEKRNIIYKGVDYCEKFIEACQKNYPEAGWEVQDARHLKEADKSYDVVGAFDVVDGMKGWEQALDEMIRVARKKIILLMWIEPTGRLEYLQSKGLTNTLVVDIYGNVVWHKLLITFIP